ncbi:MAG: PHP domain-containing protein [Methanomicrobiales archaeon]|nr:PHP domain-containing protein [Methanomicrobiales archaeon]
MRQQDSYQGGEVSTAGPFTAPGRRVPSGRYAFPYGPYRRHGQRQVFAQTDEKNGFGCAVTDHNEVSGALAACRERDDLLVIPGIEISTCVGPHILVYFYDPHDLDDFFQEIYQG